MGLGKLDIYLELKLDPYLSPCKISAQYVSETSV